MLSRSAAREMRCFFCNSDSHLAVGCPREGQADAMWALGAEPRQLRAAVEGLRKENRELRERVERAERAAREPAPALGPPAPAPPLAPAADPVASSAEGSAEDEHDEQTASWLIERVENYEAEPGPPDGRLDDLIEAEGPLVRWKTFVADRWPGEEERRTKARAVEMARTWGFTLGEDDRPQGSLSRTLWREKLLHGGPWLVRKDSLLSALRIEYGVE